MLKISLALLKYYGFWSIKYSIPESSSQYPQDAVYKTTYLLNLFVAFFSFNSGRRPCKSMTGQKWGNRCTLVFPALTSVVTLKGDSAMWVRDVTEVHLHLFLDLPFLFPSTDVRAVPDEPFLLSLTTSFAIICLFSLQRPIIYICKTQFFLKPIRCFVLVQCRYVSLLVFFLF